MAGSTKASTLMTKKRDKEHSTGLTAENMKDLGRMVSKMEMVLTRQRVERSSLESGKKARDSNGLMKVETAKMRTLPNNEKTTAVC